MPKTHKFIIEVDDRDGEYEEKDVRRALRDAISNHLYLSGHDIYLDAKIRRPTKGETNASQEG